MADTNNLTKLISDAVAKALNESGQMNQFNANRSTEHLPGRSEQRANITHTQLPSHASTSVALPSGYRRTAPHSRTVVPSKKRRGTATTSRVKTYTKNVVCIPPNNFESSSIPIPRGENRASLMEAGLVAKLSFDSTWNETQICAEIYGLFKQYFENENEPDRMFSFEYLSFLDGTKKLCRPRTSTLFQWDAQQVLSICSRDTLYIIAGSDPLPCKIQTEIPVEAVELKQVLDVEEHTSSNIQATDGKGPSRNILQTSLYETLVIEEEIEISDDEVQDEVADQFDVFEEKQTSLQKPRLKDILWEIKGRQETDDERRSYVNVRRSQLWVDSCRFLQRKKFNPVLPISVRFADDQGTSEGAVDAGGPRREFLRLLLKACHLHSGIFCGSEHYRVLFLNFDAREKGIYRLVGMIIAWSIFHGGPAGNFFSKSLFNGIVHDGSNGVCETFLEDVPNPDVREQIRKVKESQSLDQLQENLKHPLLEDILDNIGMIPQVHVSTLSDKEKVSGIIVRYIVYDSVVFLIEELKQGLKTLGMLECIQKYPSQFSEIFCKQLKPLDAHMVDVLFTPTFSEDGSNAKHQEEQAIVYWRDYLQDCDDGDAQATLEDVLIFATGANSPPPIGFDEDPKIAFTEEKYPKANTCVNLLYLPTQHNCFEVFKETIDFTILNSPTFGHA